MEAHRIETIVQPHGRVVLENLPFEEGEMVEIIIIESGADKRETAEADSYPLRGTEYKYEDPFEPAVSPEAWEALK